MFTFHIFDDCLNKLGAVDAIGFDEAKKWAISIWPNQTLIFRIV